jgi:membrane protein implicated in regulation of membrane protease activity
MNKLDLAVEIGVYGLIILVLGCVGVPTFTSSETVLTIYALFAAAWAILTFTLIFIQAAQPSREQEIKHRQRQEECG